MTKMNNQESDQVLLQHYRENGETELLGILLKRYSLLLFGVCMKYLKNTNDAKDAVQQVFEKTIAEAHKYEIPFFKSWIYSVARNHCLMLLRSNSVRNRKTEEIPEDLISTDLSYQELQSKEIVKMSQEKSLMESIRNLGEEQSICINMFYLQKLSYQEIQDKTGFNFQQVKSHIQNGKRNLRIILEKKLRENEK
jgi:RNA polymerase sigma-70 factor (ECF subfamily)